MMNESYLAVVARNEDLQAGWATEPYECAWASEAIFFVRVLGASEASPPASVRVQISPDGIHWADEGTVLDIPARESVVFARLRHFGGWLRLVAHTQDGAKRRLICYLSLKG
jgi:hypothetical protein